MIKLSKKLALGCFVLSSVMLFGGCFLLSSNNNESATANNSSIKENNSDTTEADKNNIKVKISNLEKEVSELRASQISTAKQILGVSQDKKISEADLTKVEKSCSEGDKKGSKECVSFLEFKSNHEEKKQQLEKAKEEEKILLNKTPTPQKTTETIVKEEDSWWNILLILVGGIVGLAVLGGLGFIGYRFFANTINSERDATQEGFRRAGKTHHELSQKINQLEQTVKLQSGQFTQIQTSLKSLERQILELGGQKLPEQQAIFTPPVYKPEPQFPVSAEDYLNKIRASGQTATADFIAGLLVNDANKGNEFLIVSDRELSENLFYAVPNQARFDTKSDYFNYYQKYYIFDNPSGGAFRIKSPAIVRRVEGGWKLEQMGELSSM